MAEPRGAVRYHVATIDLESDSTHARVVRLVGTGKRVLELGCATGYMSQVFRDRGCQVVAVEVDQEAAEHASAFCERVIVGDLDTIDLAAELGKDRFDVVVAADVLEHLKNPLRTLRAAKKQLRPDGYFVASIPNIAHGSVRLSLLSGQFPYSETGLLDRTHIRFFTLESMERLFEDAGFALGHLERQQMPIGESEVPFEPGVARPETLELLAHDPEALTYQFVVAAYPLTRSDLSAIRQKTRELAKGKEVAEREVTELKRAVGRQAELEIRIRELAADRETLERSLRDLTEEKATVERELAAAKRGLEDVTRERDVLRLAANEQDALQARLRNLANEREVAQRDLTELRLQQAALEREGLEHRLREAMQEREAADRRALALQEALRSQSDLEAEIGALAGAKEEARQRAVEDRAERDRLVRELAQAHERVGELEGRLDDVTGGRATLEEQLTEQRQAIVERDASIAALTAQVHTMTGHQSDLRQLLLEAHDELLRSDADADAVHGYSAGELG